MKLSLFIIIFRKFYNITLAMWTSGELVHVEHGKISSSTQRAHKWVLGVGPVPRTQEKGARRHTYPQ